MSDKVFYIVVLGSSSSGKNELISRLTREIYDPEYLPMIQDYFEKKIVIDKVRSFSHDDNLNIVLAGTKCESQECVISQFNILYIIYIEVVKSEKI